MRSQPYIVKVTVETPQAARDDEGALLDMIRLVAEKVGSEVVYDPAGTRTLGGLSPTEIILSLGSAGAFTAVFEVIAAYVRGKSHRRVQIECGDKALSIDGHSLSEEAALLDKLLSLLKERDAANDPRSRGV